MKAISEAHFASSVVALNRVFKDFKIEIEGDEVIKNHTKLLYENLLEKNLFKIIDSYTRVDIQYVAKKLNLNHDDIERKLSEMILDRKILGTLDQSRGCLIVYHEPTEEKLYKNSEIVIENMLGVVQKLNEASKVLKKH